MRKTSKAMTAVASAAILTITGASTVAPSGISFSDIPVVAAVDNNNDDWLHVCGNEIHDKNCNEVWLTGVNWFGFNCNEVMFHGLDAGKDFRKIASGIADKGFNCVRVPIATELLVSWMNGDPVKGSTNFSDSPYYTNNPWFLTADGEQMNSMEIFDACMNMFKEYGLKVIIDIHSAEIDNSGHDKRLWYYGDFTTEDWQDTLVWLADKYKNDDTIIAYDIKNEPHGDATQVKAKDGAKWDDSTDLHNWRYAAETCGQEILKVNPNALVLIEGIQVYPKFENGQDWNSEPGGYGAPENYYPGWWGGNLRGVKDFPIELISPSSGKSQLVYSPHEYGPSVHPQEWFQKEFTLQTLLDDYMQDTWAYLLPDYPMLIGEWGGHMDGDKNQRWMEILRDYMIDNTLHHTFWCVNPNSGDTGGLLDHSWDNWDMEKYGLVEPSLWQTLDTGKYIGLDHQIPLGENGITLNEFYSSYSSTEGSNIGGGTKGSGNITPTNPTTPPTTSNTTSSSGGADVTVWGDANCDENVDMSDAVLIMQSIANPDKYGVNGSETSRITEQGKINGDVYEPGSDITSNDALSIQKFRLSIISTLPEA